jgi:hypothetical protein
MHFDFHISVDVERTEGKFASRDEMEEQVREALEGADPGQLDGENGGMYETTDWTVEVEAKA